MNRIEQDTGVRIETLKRLFEKVVQADLINEFVKVVKRNGKLTRSDTEKLRDFLDAHAFGQGSGITYWTRGLEINQARRATLTQK